jgi:hypothetical protein
VFIFAGGQHLVISPRQTQIKTIDSGVIFTCTLTDYDRLLTPAPIMSWRSPQHVDISSMRGRYVETNGSAVRGESLVLEHDNRMASEN